MTDPGEVFISYSWDDDEHVKAVLALSNRLRSDGIDCTIDQYEVSPPEGWPRWMERKITDAGLVLVICTKTYLDRALGREGPSKGLGVKWEGAIIYQHLYNQGAYNHKFVPVLMKSAHKEFIPIPLQSASYFAVDSETGYERLYNRLLGKPPAEKPPLGKRKPKPPREVKTNPVAFISIPINVPLWDKAKWKGTFFAQFPGSIPILGIAFLNKEPAEAIFKEWIQRYGEADEFEELRIAIIEGDIPGKEPGYSIQIGIDHENVLRRFKQAGLPADPDPVLITVSRIHRMNPAPGSRYLPLFKEGYKEYGEYLLVPAVCEPDGSNPQMAPVLGIRKKMIHFRRAEDIGPNDPDIAVLGDEKD
jgi:hypothetical protein